MTVRQIPEWFEMIQKEGDLKIATRLVEELDKAPANSRKIENVLCLITAIRLDQMSKETMPPE